MTLVDALGWTATLLQTVLAVPQLVRLVRTRNVEGLSLVGWQTALVLNLAWTWHGISIDQLPQTLSSALSLFTTVPILVLMTRALGRSLVRTVLPSVVVAAAMIAVGATWIVAAFNVVWYVLRRLGLRAFFPRADVALAEPVPVTVGEFE